MRHSPLREAQHKALATLTLSGNVLDLGGDQRSAYQRLFRGSFRLTTVNLDHAARPDIVHDLERPLPIADDSYEHVLLINVLEHIYDYKQLLSEASRVTRRNGTVIIAVPFLYPIHRSPTLHDYRRFTDDALRSECAAVGLSVIQLEPLGTGIFSAASSLLWRALRPFRIVFLLLAQPLRLLDRLHARYARANLPEHYALGYLVVARKG
jgi:SAM-dependent methyltransferase